MFVHKVLFELSHGVVCFSFFDDFAPNDLLASNIFLDHRFREMSKCEEVLEIKCDGFIYPRNW